MQIKLTSIFVNDQEKALKFYTDVRPKSLKACSLFWSPAKALTLPRRRINKRFIRAGFLQPTFLLQAWSRNSSG